MRYAVYALLPSKTSADQALEAIDDLDVDDRRATVRRHDQTESSVLLGQDTIDMGETAGRGRLIYAALVGALAGGVLLTLVFALVGSTRWLAAFVLGALAGGLVAPLLRGLAGTAVPDSKLQDWLPDLRRGGVVLTCDVDSLTLRERCSDLLRSHGALEIHHQTL